MAYTLEVIATGAALSRDPRILRAFRRSLAGGESLGLRFGAGDSRDWLEILLPYRGEEESARALLLEVVGAAASLGLMVHDPQLGAALEAGSVERTLACWSLRKRVLEVEESAESIDQGLAVERAERSGFAAVAVLLALALVIVGLIVVCGAVASAGVHGPPEEPLPSAESLAARGAPANRATNRTPTVLSTKT